MMEVSEPYSREYREDKPINHEKSADAPTSDPEQSKALTTMDGKWTYCFGVPSRYKASTKSMTKQNSRR